VVILRALLLSLIITTTAWGYSDEWEWPPVPERQRLEVIDTPKVTPASMRVLQSPEFKYPYALRKAGVQGRIIVCMTVEKGRVVQASVLQSSGSNLMDEYVVSLAQRFQFTEGPRASCTLSVSFQLE
jgi:TonB family protein